MEEKSGEKKAKKGFLSRIFDKLDKKMEEKAKKSDCGCCGDNNKGKSCCS